LQDAAVSALRELPQTDLTNRDPFGWLCQLAEERLIDRAREFDADKRDIGREVSGHQRVPSEGTSAELMEMLAASLTSVTKAVVRNERHARLQECLLRLPAETQDILRMRYVDGITTREIGAAIGKSDGAVRVLLSRTLRELQTALPTTIGPD
jgi:RNA polymerase sigma-70 factor (ECF subfamily)